MTSQFPEYPSPGERNGPDVNVGELQLQLEEALRRIDRMEATINRWRLHGLSVLDTQPLFLEAGGSNGSSPQAARSDHT